MWDLETIIKINNEAQRAFEKKNAYEAYQRKEEERRKRVLNEEAQVFEGFTNMRSVYEGEVDGCTPHSRSGEELS